MRAHQSIQATPHYVFVDPETGRPVQSQKFPARARVFEFLIGVS
jgi:hypothetical protein